MIILNFDLKILGKMTESNCKSCSICAPADDELVSAFRSKDTVPVDNVQVELSQVELSMEEDIQRNSRTFSSVMKKELKKELMNIGESVYAVRFDNFPIGYTCLNKKTITAIVDKFETVYSDKDLEDLVEDKKVRQLILWKVSDYFGDVDTTQLPPRVLMKEAELDVAVRYDTTDFGSEYESSDDSDQCDDNLEQNTFEHGHGVTDRDPGNE